LAFIDIALNTINTSDSQRDISVLTQGTEIGAGWTDATPMTVCMMPASHALSTTSASRNSMPISAVQRGRMMTISTP
jgi:hypothetical protein